MQWYLNSAVFLLVAAYALKRNEHVRIDVIAGRLSPRAQAWIDIVGSHLHAAAGGHHHRLVQLALAGELVADAASTRPTPAGSSAGRCGC